MPQLLKFHNSLLMFFNKSYNTFQYYQVLQRKYTHFSIGYTVHTKRLPYADEHKIPGQYILLDYHYCLITITVFKENLFCVRHCLVNLSKDTLFVPTLTLFQFLHFITMKKRSHHAKRELTMRIHSIFWL